MCFCFGLCTYIITSSVNVLSLLFIIFCYYFLWNTKGDHFFFINLHASSFSTKTKHESTIKLAYTTLLLDMSSDSILYFRLKSQKLKD